MKKLLLTMLMAAVSALSVNAATNYQINVGGVEVTSDNASYITGGDIKSGYGVYNASTKTLTLYNINISRTTSGDYALHNRDCFSLTVEFVGTCNLSSTKARAIRFEENGKLKATSGSTVNVTGSDDGAIYVRNESSLEFYGPGTFNIKSTSKKGAIQGNKSGTGGPIESVSFYDDVNAVIESPESALYDIWSVYFYKCNVTLKSTNNSNYPVVRNVGKMYFKQSAAILAPYGAYFSSSSESILSSSGSKIYNQDILISSNYVAIINSTNFPDANFRQWMLNAYPKGYIDQSDVNNRSSIDVSGKSISNLTGVSYFSKLTSLNCSNNYLLSPLPTLPSTLQTLNCSSNGFSQLDASALKKLKTLDCSKNTITSITLPSSIETLNISYNTKFTTFSMVNESALKSLDFTGCTGLKTLSVYNNSQLYSLTTRNCTALTTLNCYSNALTSLYVSGCSALTTIDCHSNNLTSISDLPNSLQTLDCSANKFSGTFNLSGRSSLKSLKINDNTSLTTLNCYNNSLTTLGMNGCTSLTTVDCHGNQLYAISLPTSVQTLNCSNNKFSGYFDLRNRSALKSLDVSNNTGITGIWCSNNALTSLSVTGCTALTILYCSDNRLTSLPSLPNTLTTLYCDNNQLTSLPTLPNGIETISAQNNKLTSVNTLDFTKLKTLDLRYNSSLTSVGVSRNYSLTSLSLSGCTSLTSLTMQNLSSFNFAGFSVPSSVTNWDCGFNNLTSLPALPSGLKTLCCYHNKLTSLPTLPSSLERLECNDNQFTTLVVTNLKNLATLRAENNPNLHTLNCSNNALTSLNVSNNTALTSLDCGNNQLTSLPSLPSSLKYLIANSNKLTSLPTLPSSLTTLECNANQLTSLPTLPSSIEGLDVSKNKFTSLTINNKLNLKNLNVSKNTLLTNLNARDNALTSINVTGCSELSYVQLQHNNLTSLYFTGCSKLHDLYITRNQIKGDKMTALINSLRTIPSSESEGVFGVIAKNSGSPEYNEITTEQVKAVRDKRWRAQEIDGNTGRWEDIPVQGSGLRGDVDGNGMVDLDDVNATINLILFYNQYKDKYPGNADLNGDRLIDVDDVKEIINIILEQ